MASCPVCLEPFSDSGDRLPRAFPCLHTICAACVDTLAGAFSSTVTCPTCRQQARITDVRTNFALVEQLQSLALLVSAGGNGAIATLDDHTLAASAPPQEALLPLADPHPWDVGSQNMYESTTLQAFRFPVPASQKSKNEIEWESDRRAILWDWGRRREERMHRPPRCLMDQMVSGGGYYPPRLLDSSWLTPREQAMVDQLEVLLHDTHHAGNLARDMLTPLLFDVDVRIVLDNSGSMSLDMLGRPLTQRFAGIEAENPYDARALQATLEASLRPGWFASNRGPATTSSFPREGPSPFRSRWWFARDAMRKWIAIYEILGLDPWTYLLNPLSGIGKKIRGSQLEQVFTRQPSGGTDMTEALERVLADHAQERPDSPLLIVGITDGEANNMTTFNNTLDSIQNDAYGEVQVCFLGLSLVREDIEWFENEECDETRIRTIEAYDVEKRQIQLRKVVNKEAGYNFAMHTYRTLVTNFFPSDYDYEAPWQNLRHRFYITLHGRDRWYGINSV
eukprot:CAMPEP_0172741050 /NCGR_PEP_ID=MMETSP1074-20121228/126253_1 /TAXON_ID=2916 /ORGANISM="Ceratium fusus, Strain PA161109" /LENGTH=507 /DNA_ID=CAMNT_0013571299 /DNA_START=58 /DNA_END=1578 /DNA_ORIENTATION=+